MGDQNFPVSYIIYRAGFSKKEIMNPDFLFFAVIAIMMGVTLILKCYWWTQKNDESSSGKLLNLYFQFA